MYKLTIALMTFNRLDNALQVIDVVSKIIKTRTDINFLIVAEKVDDPNTWERLNALQPSHWFELLDGKRGGFSGAFFASIINSNSEYCLHLSDEDSIYPAVLDDLIKSLDNSDPDLFVCNYEIIKSPSNPIKYRSNNFRIIRFSDIFSLYHNPGMIWNVSSSKKLFDLYYKTWVERFPQLLSYYPHLLLAIHLMPNKKTFFYNNTISYQTRFDENQHSLSSNRKYSHFSSRILQYFEIEDCLLLLKNDASLNDFHIKYYKNALRYLYKIFFIYVITHFSSSKMDRDINYTHGFVSHLLPYFLFRKNFFRIRNFFSKLSL